MTNGQIVDMLSWLTMTHRHVALACLLAAAPLLLHCEAADETPPVVPQNAQAPAPPPPGPPAAPAGTTDDNAAQYASGEYSLGADSDTYQDTDPSALTDFRPTL